MWEEDIMATKQRNHFQEIVRKTDPKLGAWYTDRRARFRRRVHFIVTLPWQYWDGSSLDDCLEEARALGQQHNVSI